MVPESDAELLQFREQVAPGMLLLGRDQPHAVLMVGGSVLMELACWNDHDDPGVLIQPFARALAEDVDPRFVVNDIPTGAAIAYEFVPGATLAPLNHTYEQMARQIAASAAPRVRWQLDSQRSRKERTA